MLSPMMVERRCPTCISLAMFEGVKSTMTFLLCPVAGGKDTLLLHSGQGGRHSQQPSSFSIKSLAGTLSTTLLATYLGMAISSPEIVMAPVREV